MTDHIDDPLMMVFQSNRKLHSSAMESQFGSHLIDNAPRFCPGPIEFVDKTQSRDVVTTHLSVDSDRLTLHTAHTDTPNICRLSPSTHWIPDAPADDEDGTVQHTQRTFDFDREIHMPWCIDDIDIHVLPLAKGRC